MKKRVLMYLVVATTVLSLQSCVSNYVVSQPITYKTNAKFASTPVPVLKKANISNNSENSIDAALANIEKTNEVLEKEKTNEYNNKINSILAEAETYLGTPYRYGGMSRSGIDCSAFVLSVFGATIGMQLPRVAAAQAGEGTKVEKSELKKGDLVFFSHGRRISHVGIVYDVKPDGEIEFIHAATSRGVMVSSLDDSYWAPKYRYAKRILSENGDTVGNTDYSTLAQNHN